MAGMRGCPALKETRSSSRRPSPASSSESSVRDKKSSCGILDDVADVMKNNAAYNLEIHGHTDSQGMMP